MTWKAFAEHMLGGLAFLALLILLNFIAAGFQQ